MPILDNIIQAVHREIAIEPAERAVLQKLMTAAGKEIKPFQLSLTDDQWLRMGVHLVSVIRRARNHEPLEPLEESVLTQVDQDMQKLSRKVLAAAGPQLACDQNRTEVFLLAVHFAAAK
jgi:PRD domain protein (TIGR03582 family)